MARKIVVERDSDREARALPTLLRGADQIRRADHVVARCEVARLLREERGRQCRDELVSQVARGFADTVIDDCESGAAVGALGEVAEERGKRYAEEREEEAPRACADTPPEPTRQHVQ